MEDFQASIASSLEAPLSGLSENNPQAIAELDRALEKMSVHLSAIEEKLRSSLENK